MINPDPGGGFPDTTVYSIPEYFHLMGTFGSYMYFPHVMMRFEEAQALVYGWRFVVDLTDPRAYADADADLSDCPPPFNQGYGNAGGNTIYRMREGIERFMITDINNPAASAVAQSEVPVMMDSMAAYSDMSGKGVAKFNHVPGGCNVLYMDGHVEFIKYPGKFPVSPELAELTAPWNAGWH